MRLCGIKIDTIFKYQIELKISDKLFYSEKYFNTKEEADEYMSFLSNNKNCSWKSIKVLCPRKNIILNELITEDYQIKNPIENGTSIQQIEKEFNK